MMGRQLDGIDRHRLHRRLLRIEVRQQRAMLGNELLEAPLKFLQLA
jgi:hypothetical protein